VPITFPTTAHLTVEVSLALGADLTADPGTWSWTDITVYVRYAPGIAITVGQRDETSQSQPAQCTLTLDNTSGRFSRRNPTGPYYPNIRLNTPLRVRVDPGTGMAERFVGFVDEWPLRWDKSGNEKRVEISASGVMRRLNQGGDLRSALYREIIASSPVAYWPLENVAPNSNQAANAIAGGEMFTGSIDLRGTDGPAGSGEVVDLSQRGQSYGRIPYRSSTAYRIELVGKIPAADPTAGDSPILMEWFTEGTNSYWRLTAQSDGFYYVERFSGGAFSNYISTTTSAFDGQWHHFRIDFSQSGGNIAATLYRDGTSIGTGSVAGTLQWPEYLAAITFDTIADDALPAVGHYAIWSNQPTTDTADAAAGWSGELATDRIARICAEEGITATITASIGEPLGPQPDGSVLTVLQDVAAADHGLLYDSDGGIVYIAREERYNLAADMALDFNSGDIQPDWEANDDDQFIRNSITATRPDGSTGATFTQADGPQGSDTIGLYPDTLNVNVADDSQLYTHAGWRVGLGTVDDFRLPQIPLNFARSPGLITSWLTSVVGSRITAANPPSELPGGTLDLQVEGYSEYITPRVWSATLNTVPNRPYIIATLQSGDERTKWRLQTDGASLNGAHNSSTTSLSVASSGTALFTTTDVPFDIEVGGEQIRVTAVSGASSPQTFTVTRSVNGVTKSHSSGATVTGWRLARIGL
jgi:hypothetical protein